MSPFTVTCPSFTRLAASRRAQTPAWATNLLSGICSSDEGAAGEWLPLFLPIVPPSVLGRSSFTLRGDDNSFPLLRFIGRSEYFLSLFIPVKFESCCFPLMSCFLYLEPCSL